VLLGHWCIQGRKAKEGAGNCGATIRRTSFVGRATSFASEKSAGSEKSPRGCDGCSSTKRLNAEVSDEE